jgi:hypothetical protein
MRRRVLFMALTVLLTAGCATSQGRDSAFHEGRRLFQTAFNPERNFAGDIRPSSDDELVLTAAASNRDDYAPSYSLAIAYLCFPAGDDYRCEGRFMARLLRVGPPGEEQIDRSFALLARVGQAQSAEGRVTALEESNLDWLEADLGSCDGAIRAMDSVRVADWRPDIHFRLQAVEDRRMILHPAMIRVRMSGSYITARYQGWVLGTGVPAAIRTLLETLEPCWRPSRSSRPWQRPGR